MGEDAKKVILNLGCGFRLVEEAINVDAFEICKPDVLWDLNKRPWPWEDNSIDMVYAYHLMEHLDDWWAGFKEIHRMLKVGGTFEMAVPDHTNTESYGYLDHNFLFTKYSFHLCINADMRGANAWARSQDIVKMKMVRYERIPYERYMKWWIPRWILSIAIDHLVNLVHEQRFSFIKTG